MQLSQKKAEIISSRIIKCEDDKAEDNKTLKLR